VAFLDELALPVAERGPVESFELLRFALMRFAFVAAIGADLPDALRLVHGVDRERGPFVEISSNRTPGTSWQSPGIVHGRRPGRVQRRPREVEITSYAVAPDRR